MFCVSLKKSSSLSCSLSLVFPFHIPVVPRRFCNATWFSEKNENTACGSEKKNSAYTFWRTPGRSRETLFVASCPTLKVKPPWWTSEKGQKREETSRGSKKAREMSEESNGKWRNDWEKGVEPVASVVVSTKNSWDVITRDAYIAEKE